MLQKTVVLLLALTMAMIPVGAIVIWMYEGKLATFGFVALGVACWFGLLGFGVQLVTVDDKERIDAHN